MSDTQPQEEVDILCDLIDYIGGANQCIIEHEMFIEEDKKEGVLKEARNYLQKAINNIDRLTELKGK